MTAETRQEQWLQNIIDAIKGDTLTYSLSSEWRSEDWIQGFINALSNATAETPDVEWREEEWYQNILDAISGTDLSYDLTAETRKEEYLQNMIDTIKGSSLTYDIAPETRREAWYEDILDAWAERPSPTPTGLNGTKWTIKDAPAYAPFTKEIPSYVAKVSYANVPCKSNGKTYAKITFSETGTTLNISYSSPYTFAYNTTNGWAADAYKTIEFTGDVTVSGANDVSEEEILGWLAENATQITG